MIGLHTRGHRVVPGERDLSFYDDHEQRAYSTREAWKEVWGWARQVASGSIRGLFAETTTSDDVLAQSCLDAREAPDPLVFAHSTRAFRARFLVRMARR